MVALKDSMIFFLLQLQNVSDIVDVSERAYLLEFGLFFDFSTYIFDKLKKFPADRVQHLWLGLERI